MLSRLEQALARFEARQQCFSAAVEVTQSMVDTLFGQKSVLVPQHAYPKESTRLP